MKLKTNYLRLALLGLAILLFAQAGLAGEIDGNWTFVFYSDQGEHPREFVLKAKGSDIDAKLGEEPFKGTFKDGQLELEGEHYVEAAGYKGVMKISGKLADGKIKGNASWDTYELTFTATKAK